MTGDGKDDERTRIRIALKAVRHSKSSAEGKGEGRFGCDIWRTTYSTFSDGASIEKKDQDIWGDLPIYACLRLLFEI